MQVQRASSVFSSEISLEISLAFNLALGLALSLAFSLVLSLTISLVSLSFQKFSLLSQSEDRKLFSLLIENVELVYEC